MNLEGKKVLLHDMSLRDGMHPKQHQISLVQMVAVAKGLDAAGVPLIEVTHGDGLGGASINYGFPAHSDEEYLRAVTPELKRAKVSAFSSMSISSGLHQMRLMRWSMTETPNSSSIARRPATGLTASNRRSTHQPKKTERTRTT